MLPEQPGDELAALALPCAAVSRGCLAAIEAADAEHCQAVT